MSHLTFPFLLISAINVESASAVVDDTSLFWEDKQERSACCNLAAGSWANIEVKRSAADVTKSG